jgi:DNA-binding transcriptional MerR regulator
MEKLKQSLNFHGRLLMKNQGLVSIGEAAALLDVPVHTIRYWEKEFGAFLKPLRTPGSHRLYGSEDLALLKRIRRMLRDDKYSIAGTRQKLEREAKAEAPCESPEPVEVEIHTEVGAS